MNPVAFTLGNNMFRLSESALKSCCWKPEKLDRKETNPFSVGCFCRKTLCTNLNPLIREADIKRKKQGEKKNEINEILPRGTKREQSAQKGSQRRAKSNCAVVPVDEVRLVVADACCVQRSTQARPRDLYRKALGATR